MVLRIILPYLISSAEQESRLACLYHLEVVIAVSGSYGIVADRLQRPDCSKLSMIAAHPDIRDVPFVIDHKLVAEYGRPIELSHERLSKLRESVAYYYYLCNSAELIEKLA